MILLCLWFEAVPADDALVAGYVTRIKGSVVARSEQLTGEPRKVMVGRALYPGERITTGADSRLEARLRDGSLLTLGEHTEFIIHQVEPRERPGRTLGELLKGVFRAVTAPEEPEQLPPDFQVRTPVATIGVRGTDFWGGFYFDPVTQPPLDVVVLAGKGVYVENAAGRVELIGPGAGTTVTDAASAPAPMKRWPPQKLEKALRAVGWE
jgi:hypothetical protein